MNIITPKGKIDLEPPEYIGQIAIVLDEQKLYFPYESITNNNNDLEWRLIPATHFSSEKTALTYHNTFDKRMFEQARESNKPKRII